MKDFLKKILIGALFTNLLILNAQDQNIPNSNEKNWNFIRENFQKSKYKDYKILISSIIGYLSGQLASDITYKKLKNQNKSYLSLTLTSFFSTLFSYELLKKLNDALENKRQLKLLLAEDIEKFPIELRNDIEKLREIIRTTDQETKKYLIQGIYRKISANLDETSKRIDFALLLKPIEVNNLIDYRSKLIKEDPTWKFIHDNITQSLKQKVAWSFAIGMANTLLSAFSTCFIILLFCDLSLERYVLEISVICFVIFLNFFNSKLEKIRNYILEKKEIKLLINNAELIPDILKSEIENLKEAINNKNKNAIKVILARINNKIDENLKDCSLKNRFIDNAIIFSTKLSSICLTVITSTILFAVLKFELWSLIFLNNKKGNSKNN